MEHYKLCENYVQTMCKLCTNCVLSAGKLFEKVDILKVKSKIQLWDPHTWIRLVAAKNAEQKLCGEIDIILDLMLCWIFLAPWLGDQSSFVSNSVL